MDKDEGKGHGPEQRDGEGRLRNDFQHKLEHLLRLTNIPEEKFPTLFAEEMYEDATSQDRSAARIKAASWLLSVRDKDYHHPIERSVKLIGRFFGQRLGIAEIPVSYFGYGYSQDEFVAAIEELKQSRVQQVAIPAPGGMEEFKAAQRELLCGSYVLYRCSLGSPHIICDILVIKPNPANVAILDVTMYCFPTQNRDSAGPRPMPDSADCEMAASVEEYAGPLYRYGDCLVINTAHFREETGVRRARTLYFPPKVERRVHWGIASGYSGILEEPFAARALAVKFSDEPLGADKALLLTKRMGRKHPEVADFLELFDNRIDEKESALSITRNHVSLRHVEDVLIPMIRKVAADKPRN